MMQPQELLAAQPSRGEEVLQALAAGDAATLDQAARDGADLADPSLLRLAIANDPPSSVEFLLRHGSDPNAWTRDKRVALFGASGSPIYLAAKRGDAAVLDSLRAHHADADAEITSGLSDLFGTPLQAAVYYGEVDTAQRLLDFGADVNRTSRHRNTALFLALTFPVPHRTKMVELLLQHHADPDIPNESGFTARAAAYSRGDKDLAALIARAKPATASQKLPDIPPEELLAIEMTVTTKAICDAKLPGFRQQTAAVYARWRARNAALIDQFEKSSQYQQAVAQPDGSAATPPQQLKEFENTCRGDLLDAITTDPSRGPDPALASPEKTWNHYLAALRAGDRDTALGCLTSTARDHFRDFLKQATLKQLHDMADAVQSFALTGSAFGNTTEAAVTMKSGQGGLIYFENDGGAWRISEM